MNILKLDIFQDIIKITIIVLVNYINTTHIGNYMKK